MSTAAKVLLPFFIFAVNWCDKLCFFCIYVVNHYLVLFHNYFWPRPWPRPHSARHGFGHEVLSSMDGWVMEGSIVKLQNILRLNKKYKAYVYLDDEAHKAISTK